jgi:hypothetical protein
MTTACPTCAQQPNEPCFYNGVSMIDFCHAARFEMAESILGIVHSAEQVKPPTVAAFDDALLKTGLIY